MTLLAKIHSVHYFSEFRRNEWSMLKISVPSLISQFVFSW